MVQQTSDKSNEHKLLSSRNAASVLEKHFPVSVIKMALRDLPNETENGMELTAIPVQPNQTQTTSDPSKLAGAKRPQADCPPSPVGKHQSPATNGSPGHLVYVRRKLETEHGKTNTSSNGDAACSPGRSKLNTEIAEKSEKQLDHAKKPEADQTKSVETTLTSAEPRQETSTNYWTERFNRLQEYLQYLDKSGSKDYAEKFHALPVEELNKHAVELEKRAIRLSLEEALQSQRVKDLNLLGKP